MQLGRIDAFKRAEENPMNWGNPNWGNTLGIWTNACTELDNEIAASFDKIDAHDHSPGRVDMPQVHVDIARVFRVPENLMINFSLWVPSAEEIHATEQANREMAGAAAGVAVKELNDEGPAWAARLALRGVDDIRRGWEQTFAEACQSILNQRTVYTFGASPYWTPERPSTLDQDELPTGIATWADVT